MERGKDYTSKLLSHVCSEPEVTTNDSNSPDLKFSTSNEKLKSNNKPEITTEDPQSSKLYSNSCSENSNENEVVTESQYSDLEYNSTIECQESSNRTAKPFDESHEKINKMENKENEATGSTNKAASPYDKPVYRELSRINGEINRLKLDELKRRLRTHRLDTHGAKDILQKRLKSYYRQQKLGEENIENPADESSRYYDYYVIIDFEATCDDTNSQEYRHEIIEFPAVLVCTKRCRVVKEFHSYVRPTINPRLTNFCTSLTGITQDKVNFAPMFPEALQKFEEWLNKNQLSARPNKFAVVTDGPWDMGRFLFQQCIISKVPYPSWGIKWINIRKTYGNFYNSSRLCLKDMLQMLGMKFEGQPHCGLDDSRNIARVTIKLLKDGANLRVNERIQLRKDGKYNPGERVVHNISRHNFNGMKKKLIATNKSNENEYDYREVGNDNLQDAECEELDTDPEHNKLWVDPSNMDDFPKLTSKSQKITQ